MQHTRRSCWIALVALAGMAPVLMLAAHSAHATFPGRNGEIAFVGIVKSGVDGYANGGPIVYTAWADGTHRQRVTHSTGYYYGSLAFSADGRRLVFSRSCSIPSCSGPRTHEHLWTIGVHGSGPWQLTFGNGYENDPSYSPDGRRILFERASKGQPALYVVRTDGTHLRQIGSGEEAKFSPNGRKIVAGGYRIDLTDADGRHVRHLTPSPPGSSYQDTRPDFSPDGRWIVFVRATQPMCGESGDIYVVRTDGTHLHLLKRARQHCAYWRPAFSPNGKQIAFVEGTDIHVMNADGTHERVMLRTSNYAAPFSWQPVP